MILDVPVGPSELTPSIAQPDEGLHVDASLLELPEQHRDAAIEAFLTRRNKPQIPSQPILDEYNPCRLPITEFNKMFPLGGIFQKWKDGIPIWTASKQSAGRLHNNKDPIHDEVIARLLKADIIKKSKNNTGGHYVILKRLHIDGPLWLLDSAKQAPEITASYFYELTESLRSDDDLRNLFLLYIRFPDGYIPECIREPSEVGIRRMLTTAPSND